MCVLTYINTRFLLYLGGVKRNGSSYLDAIGLSLKGTGWNQELSWTDLLTPFPPTIGFLATNRAVKWPSSETVSGTSLTMNRV